MELTLPSGGNAALPSAADRSRLQSSGVSVSYERDWKKFTLEPAIDFLRAEIAVTHNLNPHLYVRPHFDFIHVADREIREKLGVRNIGILGVAVGFKF